jgi:hypothetical protein
MLIKNSLKLTANFSVSLLSFMWFLKPYGASHPSQGLSNLQFVCLFKFFILVLNFKNEKWKILCKSQKFWVLLWQFAFLAGGVWGWDIDFKKGSDCSGVLKKFQLKASLPL